MCADLVGSIRDTDVPHLLPSRRPHAAIIAAKLQIGIGVIGLPGTFGEQQFPLAVSLPTLTRLHRLSRTLSFLAFGENRHLGFLPRVALPVATVRHHNLYRNLGR